MRWVHIHNVFAKLAAIKQPSGEGYEIGLVVVDWHKKMKQGRADGQADNSSRDQQPIVGLRVPSIVFFVLALLAAGLVARLLVDARAAVLLPLALACAPLAVELSTFGRMYSLLLAATLWSTPSLASRSLI